MKTALRAALMLTAATLATGVVTAPVEAREVELTAGRQAATVKVSIGKSEGVRTAESFSEVIVSDPDVADAIPLTDRSLSVLGKKIGTARVSVYGEAKKLVGVFDIEVSYDTSRLGSELAQRFPHARFRVSSVNGRIMLVRHRAERHDGRPGDDRRQAIRRRRHQCREGEFAATGHAGGALRRGFALGKPRARRQLAGAENDISRQAAPASAPRSATSTLISGAAPFGTIVGRMLGKRRAGRRPVCRRSKSAA